MCMFLVWHVAIETSDKVVQIESVNAFSNTIVTNKRTKSGRSIKSGIMKKLQSKKGSRSQMAEEKPSF